MELLGQWDVDGLLELYADDAEVMRFRGTARGHAAIREYLVDHVASYRTFEVVSLDQFAEAPGAVMWEATIDTDAGPVQMYDVVVLDTAGKIVREFPGLHGFWGS